MRVLKPCVIGDENADTNPLKDAHEVIIIMTRMGRTLRRRLLRSFIDKKNTIIAKKRQLVRAAAGPKT
jgi:hypothetical protein